MNPHQYLLSFVSFGVTTAPASLESEPPSSSSSIKERSTSLTASGESSASTLDQSSSSNLPVNLSVLGLCGIAFTTGESWVALGNSLTLAIYNGGSAGVIYGFIATSMCYWLVAAAVAELASAMPSTATAYRWASVTGGSRYGGVCSWFAGYWLWAAWIVGPASLVSFMALQALAIYEVLNPGFAAQDWHVFCSYIVCNCVVCLLVLFADHWLDRVQRFGVFFSLGGWLVSVVICAIGPRISGQAYADSRAVWLDWQNETGWSSGGFVFCLGMLNAALAVGAPDISCHMAEQISRPSRNLPFTILTQYAASFVTGLSYLIILFYTAPDIADITATHTVFPLAQIYYQATGTRAATVGLLVVALLPTTLGATGAYAIAGRQGWALARENVLPCSSILVRLNKRTNAPFNMVLLAGIMTSLLGLLYLVSATAFNALTGSFVVFSSLSYLAALVPHALSNRRHITSVANGSAPTPTSAASSAMTPGPSSPRPFFRLPARSGLLVCTAACIYLAAFAVIFCFPPTLPVNEAGNLNFTPVIVSGWTLATAGYGGFRWHQARGVGAMAA